LILKRNVEADPGERALWGDLMSLGFSFPLCIALGFFLGRWVGGWWGHPAFGQWIGLAWGIAAAFWELYKVNRRMARRDAAELEKLGPGPGPGEGQGPLE